MSSSLRFQQSMRVGVLGTVRMGKSFDSLLSPGAQKLGVQTSGTTRFTDFDVNGDGKQDVTLIEGLDASGKVTRRSFDLFEQTSRGPRTFFVTDSNDDGKIDGFTRSTATGYATFNDLNDDGKTDAQSVTRSHGGHATSSQSLYDVDHDGKADLRVAGKLPKKGQLLPKAIDLPVVGEVIGKSIDSVLQGATRVGVSTGSGSRRFDWDLNHDGKADLSESDLLDSSGQVTWRNFSIAGQPDSAFGDDNKDGKIDRVSQRLADGRTEGQYDWNGDGEIDGDSVFGPDGAHSDLVDQDHDGVVDWVVTSSNV